MMKAKTSTRRGKKNTRSGKKKTAAASPWALLWQAWQSQPAGTHLDRWLRQQLSRLIPAPAGHAALVAKLHKAVSYQQLICALAHAHTTGSASIDWLNWDKHWSPADVAHLPVAQLQLWLDLRLNPDIALPPEQAGKAALVRAFRDRISSDPACFALWHGLRPQWLAGLKERSSASGWSEADYQRFITLQVRQPPLWLRVQSTLTPQQALAQLQQEGVRAELRPEGLCAHGGASIHGTRLYRSGVLEIQDLASQQLAARVAVQPGQKIWDVCAGAGGKTLAIAARLQNKGMVLATDANERKLQELKRRAKRAQHYNVRSFVWRADAPLVLPKEVARQQGFDWVLVDAPCSASGTWRRNPEARWHHSAGSHAELLALQHQILTQALPAVRAGGHLVYATCSWEVRENEQQVERLLAEHTELRLVSQALVGCPQQDADTMFVAVLQLAGG